MRKFLLFLACVLISGVFASGDEASVSVEYEK